MIGILIFSFFIQRNRLFKEIMTDALFEKLLGSSIILGIVGGRLLFLVQNSSEFSCIADIFKVWMGGLSVQGAILALIAWLVVFAFKHGIPPLKLLDLVATYVPLLHAISRVGCFMSGCCAGRETASFLAVTYVHPDSFAPLHCAIHPSQLYSAAALLVLFFILFKLSNYHRLPSGTLFFAYLLGSGIERFMNDYFRHEHTGHLLAISSNQALAALIACTGLFLIFYNYFSATKSRYESI